MGINTIPISGRTAAYDPATTANGSYTLPRYAFIPNAALQQLAGPIVLSPGSTMGGQSQFVAPPILQRPYPAPAITGVYGIRQYNLKSG